MFKMNVEKLVRTALLSGFAALLIYLLASGRIGNFVHPRMLIFVRLSAILLLWIALVQGRGLVAGSTGAGRGSAHGGEGHSSGGPTGGHDGHGRRRILAWAGYGLILLPVALGFLFADEKLSPAFAGQKLGSIGSPAGSPRGGTEFPEDGPLIFREDIYYQQILLLYYTPGRFAGRDIEIYGQVYHSDGYGPGVFALARYLVTCCTADAQMVGIYCNQDELGEIEDQDWVVVKGTVFEGVWGERIVPMVEVREISPTEPRNPYLYY